MHSASIPRVLFVTMCLCSADVILYIQITWTAKALVDSYDNIEFGAEQLISYLPLSHIAGQVCIILVTCML